MSIMSSLLPPDIPSCHRNAYSFSDVPRGTNDSLKAIMRGTKIIPLNMSQRNNIMACQQKKKDIHIRISTFEKSIALPFAGQLKNTVQILVLFLLVIFSCCFIPIMMILPGLSFCAIRVTVRRYRILFLSKHTTTLLEFLLART